MNGEALSTVSGAPQAQQVPSTTHNVESLLGLLNTVAATCRGPNTIDDIVSACLAAVREYTGWPVAHAYRRRASGDPLAVSTRLWHFEPGLDSMRLTGFVEISENTEFAENQGLIGKVLVGKEALTLADVGTTPGFIRAPQAVENGLHGCFAFPVLAWGKVEFIFEFFSREVAILDAELLELMRFVGDALGHAAERSKLIVDFNDNVKAVVEQMNQAVKQIGGAITELEGSVADTQTRCQHAAGSITTALDDTRGIVGASHAMADSARDVLGRSRHSLKQTREARERSESVNQQVKDFAKTSEEIDFIRVKIMEVTRKTNILALNASIEAARAGEAGHGFNVVAREVKGLTSETALATDQIGALVDSIGQSVAGTISSMEQITAGIIDSESLSSTVAEEMAAQTEITQNIDQLVARNAEASEQAQVDIEQASEASQRSGRAALDAAKFMALLSDESEYLARAVAVFMRHLSGRP